MNVPQYLQRINYRGDVSVNSKCLRELHKCHVFSVPFETLDIHFSRQITLNLPSIYEKVVEKNRGGFCYELNYLFYNLLTRLGFDCFMVSARIATDETFGPEFDHMALVVSLAEDWLVDVGYGDLFIEPLKINVSDIQEDYFKKYKIERVSDNEFLLSESLKNSPDFKKRYRFGSEPQAIEAFAEQCHFKQSSPDSYFVQNTVCTLPTALGRKTIVNNVFKLKSGDNVIEKTINGNEELLEILRREFVLFN